jgi:hypothetical protein
MKKQKRVKFTLTLALAMGLFEAQAQQAASAAGGTATGSGGSATYTLGQVGYTYQSNATGASGAGVQQAYEYLIGVDEMNGISISMKVYPNPVNSVLNIKIENNDFKSFSYQLFDISGRLILENEIKDALSLLTMENLANADYLLKILKEKKEVKTFKIIKNN